MKPWLRNVLLILSLCGGCSYAWKLNGWGLDLEATGSEQARPADGGAPLAVPVRYDAGT